jgi:hypothetical protein
MRQHVPDRLVEASCHDTPLWKPQVPRCRQQVHKIRIAANDFRKSAPLLFVMVHP